MVNRSHDLQNRYNQLMRLIVITQPDFFNGEAELINTLFACGLQTLHLRKPYSSYEEINNLLQSIDKYHHSKIVIHDHFNLIEKYDLKGVHLNRRNSDIENRHNISVSISCHSIDELKTLTSTYDYVFLSPIYDSISKIGYKASFTEEELLQAKDNGFINSKVIALGGITDKRLDDIAKFGFSGAAILGDVWANTNKYFDILKTNKYT